MVAVAVGNPERLVDRNMSCSHRTFYEVLLNEYKNRIIALQGGLDKDRKYKRKWLEKRIGVYEQLFGKGSEQHKQCEEDLIQHDTSQLKEETSKYIRFMQENNEKKTRKFCKLGKNTSTVDAISQILKADGSEFEGKGERVKHIRENFTRICTRKR